MTQKKSNQPDHPAPAGMNDHARTILIHNRRIGLVILILFFAQLPFAAMVFRPPPSESPSPIPANPPLFGIDLNSAHWPALAQLPGIGENLARRIVAHRSRAAIESPANPRPFNSPGDLARISGIGQRKIHQLARHVRGKPPPSSIDTPSNPE